ncbi:hypothetical protein [Kitasatospora griseola]|uniref:hypothetical protein n=1 Tax=Kitasatospora griseola TaxID=2064 RepID=UPI00166FD35C|nr:hypothetical protein [Kitasatospora griseola]GGQ53953.1 hypothetical protein GCM10010195_06680 [Kitasatospora griseola]
MDGELAYRAVLAVDIERSAGRGDPALLAIRAALRTVLRESFERSRIDWEACRVDDLGDGLRVTAPAGVRKAALVHPLFDEVAARLRAHNRLAGALTTIRVRMALHAGDVRLGPDGEVAGRPLEVLARLLDAPAVRTELAEAPPQSVAVLVLSEHFHEETVQPGRPGIEPEAFRQVAVANKEFTTTAWIRTAPAEGPSEAAAPAVPAVPAAPPPAGPSRMTNRATGHGVIYAVQNGVQHITTTRRT